MDPHNKTYNLIRTIIAGGSQVVAHYSYSPPTLDLQNPHSATPLQIRDISYTQYQENPCYYSLHSCIHLHSWVKQA
jgi:hypothetical protein